jgi:hypothetical protein
MSSPNNPLDWPEDHLWIRREDGSLTIIDRDRLHDLLYGGATPEDTTEEILVQNHEWLRICVKHSLGEWPITIPAAGPLPEWDPRWLRAVGETDEPLSEEEAEALRKLAAPALAWDIDPGVTPAVGPSWLIKSRSPSPTR